MDALTCMYNPWRENFGWAAEEGLVFDFPIHTHMYYEMTLYTPFCGHVTVNGIDIPIDRPTVILVTPSDFHRICVDATGNGRFLKISFDEQMLPTAWNAVSPMVLRIGDSDSVMPGLLREVQTSVREDASTWIHAAVLYMLRHGEPVAQNRDGSDKAWIMRAVGILNQRFAEDISLSDMAQMLSVSPQYLSKVFSATMGMGFAKYVCRLRLCHAAELLRSTNLCVTDICYQCGYRNLSHFLRSFHRQYGVSPLKYRTAESETHTKGRGQFS